MLKTHHIFIRLKTTQEDNGANDKDHYDNCYGNDTDEYEEHLGSIDSLGKGGGVLLHVNYLTPCDLYCVETPEVTPWRTTIINLPPWLEVFLNKKNNGFQCVGSEKRF